MIKRRALIKTSAAAAIGFPAITHCKSPNSKLGIGLIGVGGRGRHHVEACKGEDIIALCDVNTTSLTSALKTAPNARTYKDIRDFYDKLDDIDAVVDPREQNNLWDVKPGMVKTLLTMLEVEKANAK